MEGPSLVILREELRGFKGKKIEHASGLAAIDYERLRGQRIKSLKSWGKHFLIEFKNFSIRIHFLMFGSYRVNETKDRNASLKLIFEDGNELNFYTCSIREIEAPLDEVYEWSADVLNDAWNAAKARKKLKQLPEMNVSDALLDQNIFAGVGNIIKNEVLFRIQVHPETLIAALPPHKLSELINEAQHYSFDFYRWKKKYELKKHWLIYNKKTCPRCHVPTLKKHIGNTQRRTFYCAQCQVLYQVPGVGFRSARAPLAKPNRKSGKRTNVRGKSRSK